MSDLRFVRIGVDADTIAAFVAESNGEVRPLGRIPNRWQSIRKRVGKLARVKQLRTCFEAGRTGSTCCMVLLQIAESE